MPLPEPPQSARLPVTLTTAVGVGAIGVAGLTAILLLDIKTGTMLNGSIVYPVLLTVAWWARSRRVLWALVCLALAFTLLGMTGDDNEARSKINRTLAAMTTLTTGVILHHLIRSWQVIALRAGQLEAINQSLATREEEVARQNEELQSQTEELERQSEELRVTNDELARRERMLEALLDLSRGLSISQSRDETLRRICDTLGSLVNGPDISTGILQIEGRDLRLVCHSGFGDDGPETKELPLDRSFSSLVFTHSRTGYIEDLALRPELIVPQPKAGKRHYAVLATPLRMAGQVMGSLEVYSTEHRAWSSEQIALIESLAQQTSTSLEASFLFEQVAQERRRLQTVLATATVGVAISNADCSEIKVNPAGAAILGVPVDADLAQLERQMGLKMYVNGQQLEHHKMAIVRACRGELVVPEEQEFITPGGRRLNILAGAAPIRDEKGTIDGAVLSFVDVTEMKRLQAELDARRREAEEAAVRKTRFLAAVSHDVRTPANAISLLAELIRRTAQNPSMVHEVPEMARELQQTATSLVNLLGDVLDVTRFDFGKIELQESEFRLADLVTQEIQQLLPLARDKGLSFVNVPPTQDIWVRADRIKLARILSNLVGNAIKFTDRGEVRIEHGRTEDGRVRIAVRDTGIGISSESIKFIFDEFFQLRNPERDRNKGTGLGLTICRRLIDAMGGEITVDSSTGLGSTFTVHLPASAVVSPRSTGA